MVFSILLIFPVAHYWYNGGQIVRTAAVDSHRFFLHVLSKWICHTYMSAAIRCLLLDPLGYSRALFFSLVTYLCIMHESAQIKLLGHRRLRQIKAAPSGPATSPTPFRLTIIHFNDVYEMAGVLEAGWRKNRMLIPASQVPIGIF